MILQKVGKHEHAKDIVFTSNHVILFPHLITGSQNNIDNIIMLLHPLEDDLSSIFNITILDLFIGFRLLQYGPLNSTS